MHLKSCLLMVSAAFGYSFNDSYSPIIHLFSMGSKREARRIMDISTQTHCETMQIQIVTFCDVNVV